MRYVLSYIFKERNLISWRFYYLFRGFAGAISFKNDIVSLEILERQYHLKFIFEYKIIRPPL